MVNGSRLVRSRLVRSRLVRSGFVRSRLGIILGVCWDTLVCNISNESSVVISSVSDCLDTAIGKSNLVGSSYSLGIRVFLSRELGSRVVISNTVLEGIWLG
uniref:Uncharacterized protein n=1 Tax=Lepeophtheirus salmonis TaxID=72036 RepID=A0A0K2TG95_LEPSM